MFMPYITPTKNDMISRITYLGDGENTFSTPFSVAESESRYSRNLSSDKYPSLSVRKGRDGVFTAITTPNALGVRDNAYLYIQDGTVYKRWNGTAWVNIQTGLTSGAGKIIEFSTGTGLHSILANGTEVYSWDGTTSTELTEAPTTNLYAVHSGRVYALDGKVLKYSALNDITDWTTANDSGYVTITDAIGDGTGIIEYDSHICVFTEDSFHELYGTGYSNYELIDVSKNGCLGDRSLVVATGSKGGLFWLDYDGVYRYTGSLPERISDNVKSYIDDINLTYKHKCCAGTNGRKIWFSIPYGSTATECNLILMYDTEENRWYPQTGSIVSFAKIGDVLYGVDSAGKFWDMENGTDDDGTAITWSFESSPRNKDTREKKAFTELWISYYLPIGSSLSIYTSGSVDNDDWKLKKVLSANSNKKTERILIDMPDSDCYRIKFSGTGYCEIYNIEELFRKRGR